MTKSGAKALLPAAALTVGLLATTALVAVRPTPQPIRPEVKPPLVEVVEVSAQPVRLSVRAQGTVEPRTESDLVTEASGRIVWAAPSLEAGRFFRKGDTLLRIDDRDYAMALERAIAAHERAASQLELARATLERRRSLRDAGAASKAALDEAESNARVAAANVRDSRAALGQARLDMDRTEVAAPFDGRVRAQHVDVGQFVGRGQAIARVYAVDYVEVRLPIPSVDLAYLDLPFGYSETPDAGGAEADGAPVDQPAVTLTGHFAGREHSWQGRIVRTEGTLDPRTRMIHAVARVESPYARAEDGERPPLAVGLFVDADIEGRVFDDVFELPRGALRSRDEVLVIDAESRMHLRRVILLRSDRDRIWVRSGLSAGERVSVTPLDVVVEGMQVRVAELADGLEGGLGGESEGAEAPGIAQAAAAP